MKEALLNLFTNFCENEYKHSLIAIEMEYGDVKKGIECSLQRCLGVAFFLQSLDVPYEDIDKVYSKYREKFYELL